MAGVSMTRGEVRRAARATLGDLIRHEPIGMATPSTTQMTLGAFRDDIQSRAMPGCGAVAANAAADGLALVLKGLRLTQSKDQDTRCARLIAQAQQLVTQLSGYADEDIAAFKAYLAAKKHADENDADKRLDRAVERINQVPLETARCCLEPLEYTEQAMGDIKPALQSDARAGARLVHAGLSMVLINVDTNIDGLEDEAERRQLAGQRAALQAEADRLLERLLRARS
ncbi:formiminotetrahydrofolate cyclodeaminase protein [Salinisphaera shabanensis E1L3A]|uniref:Formiminotetrahydrofolate cyclodeaminase protein n=1 Tax=Salinisphaera shabanensis E1L3A TaxID=1033802 RepID=U2EB45_9GAMM|nr:cyclodeaminase/cyclohydrolase family protein [Salinisphaera shabanensis]ERJ20871.1 formiminotetrahydrofolate cyclodeaminase protein [Salinisphaera shabanensis E1L3A]